MTKEQDYVTTKRRDRRKASSSKWEMVRGGGKKRARTESKNLRKELVPMFVKRREK